MPGINASISVSINQLVNQAINQLIHQGDNKNIATVPDNETAHGCERAQSSCGGRCKADLLPFRRAGQPRRDRRQLAVQCHRQPARDVALCSETPGPRDDHTDLHCELLVNGSDTCTQAIGWSAATGA